MYKFKLTQGCLAYNFTVDDKQIDELSSEEKNSLIDYLLAEYKERIADGNRSIQSLVEAFDYDSWESDGHSCEQCGDTVSKTTWEI